MDNINSNQPYNNSQEYYKKDESSILASLIGFFIPYVGVILYFLKRRETPNLAKSFKSGVMVNLILSAICFLLYFLSIPLYILLFLTMNI